MASHYKNPTEVQMNKIVSADNIQTRNQALLAGELLKAMDTVACLSAEKHAGLPCVTLMMDDLEVADSLSHGHVLNVKAKVTRAFGSSMEVVVEVALENIFQAQKTNVCQAYFTFVAIAKTGKAKLSPLDPVTMEERLEYALASERRKIRLGAVNKPGTKGEPEPSMKNSHSLPETGDTDMATEGKLRMSETSVESIELVLPSHANHHKTTFGGQIMAWLVSVCTISASRLCQSAPSIVAVNGIRFLDHSSVGDRLVFKAMVNKTFDDHSMEVGCRVEASGIDGKIRHINSAYLTFVNFDDYKQRLPLPEVLPTTAEQIQRQRNAQSRLLAQIEKKKILETVGPALSVPWSKENSSILAYHNVLAFRKLCHLGNWVEISREDRSSLSKCTQDQLQCVKVESMFDISTPSLFQILNSSVRHVWDPIIAQCKIVKKIDEGDKIVHFVMQTNSPDSTVEPIDLLVLQSSRPASDSHDDFVIAFRSITLDSFPPLAAYSRRENLSSGFLIRNRRTDPEKSTLIYVNQLTDQVAAYMFSDFTGQTKMYAERVRKLREFVKVASSGAL